MIGNTMTPNHLPAKGECSNQSPFVQSTDCSCSPACTSCTGPSSNECLACSSPRANLAGSCVGFSAITGVCDSSLSDFDGVFVVNNEKKRCDGMSFHSDTNGVRLSLACPAGCASCTLPNYSSAASFSSITCQACQDGYLMESGKCVRTCSEGYFVDGTPSRNGTCQRAYSHHKPR